MPWRLIFGVFFISLLSLYWFWAMAYQTDSPSYVNAVLLWAGEPVAPDRLFRLSKPLSLLFPLFAYRLLGVSVLHGLFVQQYLAYWLSSYFLYKLLKEITPSQATYGTLAYLFCQPMAVYGLAYLTDGLGWCLLLFGLYWSQQFFNKTTTNYWRCFAFGLYLGAACFVKESVVVAGLFTAWWVLFNKAFSFPSKFLIYANIALGGLLALGAGNALTYFYWDSSLIQWIQFGQDTPPPFSWKGFLAQAYHTLDAYWWLFLGGCWLAWQQRKQLSLVFWAYAATFLSGWFLLPLTWPYLYDRILFMLVPPMLPFLALGIGSLGRAAWPLLLLCGSSQLWVTHAIYFHQQQGLILIHGLLFLCLFLVTALIERKRVVLLS
ncbi:MAG: hypothetical protein ACRBFS_13765 [Aureispira sp.]